MTFTPMRDERCDDCSIYPMSLTRQNCGGATCGDCDATHASNCLDCEADSLSVDPSFPRKVDLKDWEERWARDAARSS